MNLRVALSNGRTVDISADFPFDGNPVGYRVIVSSSMGIVVGHAKGGKRLQAQFIDANPLVLPEHIEVIKEISGMYGLTPWNLLFRFLPKALILREQEYIVPPQTIPPSLDRITAEVISYLSKRKKAKPKSLEKKFGRDVIRFLLEKGFLGKRKVWKMPDRKEELMQEKRGVSCKTKRQKGSYVLVGTADAALEKLKSLIKSTLERGSLLVFCSGHTLPWLEEELKGHFGDLVLSLKAKGRLARDWFRCQEGKRVILGTDVALLSPIRDLMSIVIFDDTGIRQYKEVDIRNFLFLLSRYMGAEFFMLIPSFDVQTYHFVLSKTVPYEYQKPDADVLVFELRPGEVLTKGCQDILKDYRDALFLVSKSGYSYAYCPRCEGLILCPICHTFLTWYREKGRLVCTNCGYKTAFQCPQCGGELQRVGFGIERAIEEIGKNFSFSTYPYWGKKYELVVVLSADTFLSYPSFHSEEDFYRYLWRAYTLAGKLLVVQSLFPESKVIKDLLRGDWKGFLEEELRRRKEEELPPFSRLVMARFGYDVEKNLRAHSISYSIRRYGKLTEIMLKTNRKNTASVLKLLRSLRPISLEVL